MHIHHLELEVKQPLMCCGEDGIVDFEFILSEKTCHSMELAMDAISDFASGRCIRSVLNLAFQLSSR